MAPVAPFTKDSSQNGLIPTQYTNPEVEKPWNQRSNPKVYENDTYSQYISR